MFSVMLVVYTMILGTVFIAFARMVRNDSDLEKGNEDLDLDVNLVLTLGDEQRGDTKVLRDLWGRVQVIGSRVRGLPERRRVRRDSRRVAAAVPQWD